MVSKLLVRTVLTTVVIPLTLTGCKWKQTSVPPETQTMTPPQPLNQPTVIAGCLRAGLAENTFVLNASKSAGAGETVTYHLVGGDSDAPARGGNQGASRRPNDGRQFDHAERKQMP